MLEDQKRTQKQEGKLAGPGDFGRLSEMIKTHELMQEEGYQACIMQSTTL
jgi:hypothetical protein